MRFHVEEHRYLRSSNASRARRPPMFATPEENGTAVNAEAGSDEEQSRIHSAEALHRLGRF